MEPRLQVCGGHALLVFWQVRQYWAGRERRTEPETTGEATLSATDFWTGFWTLFWGPIQGWIFHRSAYKPASFQQHIETQAGFVTIEIHLPNLR